MVTVTQTDSAPITIPITLTSLGESQTFVTGRESDEIDNTTTVNYVDATVHGKIRVGTTPDANTSINIYVWGAQHSIANPDEIDVLDGADSDETLTNTGILNSALKLARVIPILSATSDVTYAFTPFSVAKTLELTAMPKFWGIFVSHNLGTGNTLHATGHEMEYVGIKYTSA